MLGTSLPGTRRARRAPRRPAGPPPTAMAGTARGPQPTCTAARRRRCVRRRGVQILPAPCSAMPAMPALQLLVVVAAAGAMAAAGNMNGLAYTVANALPGHEGACACASVRPSFFSVVGASGAAVRRGG